MRSSTLIMYLDIDAFFPSVEQARFPLLKGKPVIVGSGVVASSSYEARKYGIHAGMPIQTALQLCPEAIVLKGHQPTYQSFTQEIFRYCTELSPSVEVYLDEIFCDLTGTPAARDPIGVARTLKARIKRNLGVTVTVAFATNRMIARLAASRVKPDGLVLVEEGKEEEFMSERLLRDVPGIGEHKATILEQLGIKTVRELRLLGFDFLRKIFGGSAPLIAQRLEGKDPVRPNATPKSISRETSLSEDTIDVERIESILYYLIERAAREARSAGLLPRTIRVKLGYGDGTRSSCQQCFRGMSVIDQEIFSIARLMLKRILKRCRIHRVGVVLADLVPTTSVQGKLYGNRLSHLVRTLDAIRSRFGHSSVIVGKSVNLMRELERDSYGYILRTPSLTK